MQIDYIPTLRVLQELYEKPRDFNRFTWYLEQMLGETIDGDLDVVLPITNANPMGREHCLQAVNALLEIDAETVARAAFAEAAALFPDLPHTVRAAVTLLDDVAGGWTNRYLTEATMRMCSDERVRRANQKRHFVLVPCWASQEYTVPTLRAEARAALYRYAHLQRHGHPHTLQQIMEMDGAARMFAGEVPQLDADELAYTAAVIAPLLPSHDFALQFAALFGDGAARSVGYTPQGLSAYAGFELALHQMLQSQNNFTQEGIV